MYLFLVFKSLLAMGSHIAECAASMEAMRTDARSSTYDNPMAVSQILPALQHKSYLSVKSKECINEDGMCSITSTSCGHCDVRLCLYTVSWCVRSYRHSGAGAYRSCGGFTKQDQSHRDGASGDIQRSDCWILCGSAKGQLSVGGPWTSQGEKCWLHVSSIMYLYAFLTFLKKSCLHWVIFDAVCQVWEGIQPVGTFLKFGERRAGQTERPQILAPLLWWHFAQSGWGHTHITVWITNKAFYFFDLLL